MLEVFGDCNFANFVSVAVEKYTPFIYKIKKETKLAKLLSPNIFEIEKLKMLKIRVIFSS
jgi:hypothetical protein